MVFKAPGDPRRPGEVRHYTRPKVNPDDATPDPMPLLALVFGMTAVTLKIKACSWLALFCVVSSMCNIKSSSADPKQIMTSFMFVIFGLISSYLTPPPKQKT
mmetsp:Transcript_14249/g.36553  ORF Transcript_14249/g.36553 Transcript_14249/m.36553 type:complete len:102 (+) Transcript_14249:202-507(+)|eukprot:jgi/Tetstr1/431169/TSEL_020881.t1